ncbi:retinol dehydrogenase 7-like [Glandiceps talaboti]
MLNLILLCVIIFILYCIVDWLLRLPVIQGIPSKYVLITGCDTGFGNQLAVRLDKKGFNVIAACLTDRGANELKNVTTERLKTVKMDVTSSNSIKQAYLEVKRFLPENTGLWGVVNNAGVTSLGGPCDWHRREHYEKCFSVNVFGVVDVTITFLPLLKKAQGRIVNVSSIVGRLAVSGPYSMSKFGVESFSDGLRVSMKCFGLSVSIIEPGFFKTNIVSESNMIVPMKNMWNELTPEVQEEYGKECFDAFIKHTNKAVEWCSTKTYLVVDAMEHALSSVRPKRRYSVGLDAKVFWIPLSLLPAWISDPIHIKLSNFQLPKMMKTLTER